MIRIIFATISHCAVVVLIFLICFGIFYNSLSNDFCFDDHLAIVNNKDTSPEFHHYELWRHDLWGKGLREFDSHRSFRPFLILLFRQFRAIFGLEPRPMRIFSIFCHSICSSMVYLLGYEVTGSALLGFGSAIMFASHPVHVESVAALVNMAEPIACIFYLLAYIAFWYSVSSKKTFSFASRSIDEVPSVSLNKVDNTREIQNNGLIMKTMTLFFTIFLWWISILTSMLFKETGVTLAGVAVATSAIHLLYSLGNQIYSQNLSFLSPINLLYKLLTNMTWLTTWMKRHFIWIAISFLSVGVYIAIRMITSLFDPVELVYQVGQNIKQNNVSLVAIYDWFASVVAATKGGIGGSLYLGKSDLIRRAENPFAFLHGREKTLSLMYLHFRYFFVMLYPKQLSAEYAFDCIPKVSDWLDPRMIYVAGMYGGILVLIFIGIYVILVQQKQYDTTPTTAHHYHTLRIHPSSLLLSLVWLIVPFIPASGVFLRLGTLLAERLLYIPSIGFCLLLSILLFKVCDFIGWLIFQLFGVFFHKNVSTFNNNKNNNNPIADDPSSITGNTLNLVEISPIDHKQEKEDDTTHDLKTGEKVEIEKVEDHHSNHISSPYTKFDSRLSFFVKFLYLIAVAVTVILYSLKTVSRNPAWKDDKTLFLDSLEVCPRSAKLHLQVAKLRMNTANYTGARYHVDMARSIDPDFCDIDYQEALLQLFYENDVETAIKVAARNLPCIYTNMQSWELLSKVWEQQIQSRPNDPVLLEKIGDICVKAGLAAIGAKKLQEAVNMAFNTKSYSVAIRASIKAENTVVDLMYPKDRILSDQELKVMRELSCSIIFLGASLRAFILNSEEQTGKMFRIPENDRKEVLRVKSVLYQAMGGDCVALGPTGEPLQYPLLAVRTLLNIMNLKSTSQADDTSEGRPNTIRSRKDSSSTTSGKNKLKRGANTKAEKRRLAKEKRELEAANERREKMKEADRLLDAGVSYAAISRYYSAMAVLYRNVSTTGTGAAIEDYASKTKEMTSQFRQHAVTAVKNWESAGQTYFEANAFKEAVRCFELAMQWGVGVGVARGTSKATSSTSNTRLEFQELSLASPPASCDIQYWHAHSLAGLESFTETSSLLLEAITSLEGVLSDACKHDKSVTTEMRSLAEQQASKLRETLTRMKTESETEPLPLYH